MTDALATYLQDHLAGAMHAIELLKAMRNHHGGGPLGQFASELLSEIEADRDLLAGLTEKAGATPGVMKEWAAWMGEKVSRLKLKHGRGDGLGTFEALEFLVVGIHGKWALWRALSLVTVCDPRFQGTDFEQLATRAKSQHDKVDARRLECARSALCPPTE
jgi:hypothetical protein